MHRLLCHVKQDLCLNLPGIYSTPCEWNNVYNGPTGWFIKSTIKVHHHNTQMHQMKKLAVAKHNTDLSYQTMLYNTSILARKSCHMDPLIIETTEIKMHPSINQGSQILPA